MAATLRQVLGNNTISFTYDSTETSSNMFALLQADIVTHGWDLYDQVSAVNAVFRSLCKDGVTYKYARLYWNANNFYLFCSNGWNNVSHTIGTFSEVGSAFAETLPFTAGGSGRIILSCHARWLYITPSTVATYDLCVIEMSCDHSQDTNMAYLPACVFSTENCGTGHGTTDGIFQFPISKAGTTTAAATLYGNSIVTILGQIGSGGANASASYNKASENIPTVTNVWTTENWALTMYARVFSDKAVRGRLYGMKVFTYGAGTKLDTVQVKCDVDYFYSTNGTLTDHILFATTSGLRHLMPL